MPPEPHALLTQMMYQGRSFSGKERNSAFLNMRDGRFATISAVSGLDFPDDGRAIALTDWDQDGDVDMWISNRNAPRLRLMRNETPGWNRYLSLRLVGDGVTTTRDAIGARATVYTENGRQMRTLRAGEGFLSQSSKWLHFGLGQSSNLERIVVEWPNGEAESFTVARPDVRYRLVQGTGRAVELEPVSADVGLSPRAQLPAPTSPAARIRLSHRVAMPRLAFKGFDGQPRLLPIGQEKPVLVNLWASWCSPCISELQGFGKNEARIREAGIEIVALTVEALDGMQQSASPDPEGVLEKIGFEFSAGWATSAIAQILQAWHDILLPMQKPLPIPSSFLIDGQGRLSAIYKGPVSVDDLIEDAAAIEGKQEPSEFSSSLLDGRVLDHPRLAEITQLDRSRTSYFIANLMLESNRLDEAVEHYREVLRLAPDFADGHYNLGISYLRMNQDEQAIAAFQRAIELAPSHANAHNNLAAVLVRVKRFDEAVAHYQEAVAIQPDFALAHFHLGNIYMERGELSRAEVSYRRAVAAQPDHMEALSNLGLSLARQGKPAEALQYFEKALGLQPDNFGVQQNLRRVRKDLESQGNP